MSGKFTWTVATPDGTVASGQCEFLVVPTTGGELGILVDHAPLVASIAPGALRVTEGESVRSVEVGDGILDVRDNQVRLLVSHAGLP